MLRKHFVLGEHGIHPDVVVSITLLALQHLSIHGLVHIHDHGTAGISRLRLGLPGLPSLSERVARTSQAIRPLWLAFYRQALLLPLIAIDCAGREEQTFVQQLVEPALNLIIILYFLVRFIFNCVLYLNALLTSRVGDDALLFEQGLQACPRH